MNGYLRIPTLQSFTISNYPLFKDNWTYNVQEGLNILLGANAIGKTTTIHMLIFAFVGDHNDVFNNQINADYFLERLPYEIEDDIEPSVKVKFLIDSSEIVIERSLKSSNLLSLRILAKEIDKTDPIQLQEEYINTLRKLGNIEDLNDLAFLLTNLLIREEEGNYLLWDQVAQSKILRLLLNFSGFQKEFNKLEEALQKADSEYKREADFLSKMRGRRDDLLEDRNREISKDKEVITKQDLTQQLQEVKAIRENLQKKRNELVDSIRSENAKAGEALDAINDIRTTIDLYEEEIGAAERQFYTKAFNSYKTEFALRKVRQRNICIVCDTKLSDDAAKSIIVEVDKTHSCPLCESPIINDTVDTSDNKVDSDRIEFLTKKIAKESKEQERIQLKYEELVSSVEKKSDELSDLDGRIHESSLDILSFQKKLDHIVQNDGIPVTDFDLAIKRIEEDISEYQKKVEPLLKKFNKKKKAIENKNKKLNKVINNFSDELNTTFKGSVTDYFGEECELFLRSDKRPKGLEIPLSYFVPQYKGKVRKFQTRVSKSEAIFLEYLFRLSILKFYTNQTGAKPFFILETSEGSFDITNTNQMADTFSEIGKTALPFMIITNLSKTEFIERMIPDKFERKKRIFNLLKHSELSENQKSNEKDLEAALKKIGII